MLKFAVGVMLTSFGTFWGAEGAGAHWPGADAALLVIIPAVLLFSLGLVGLLRRQRPTEHHGDRARTIDPREDDPAPAGEQAMIGA
jgi:hypothetical protein